MNHEQDLFDEDTLRHIMALRDNSHFKAVVDRMRAYQNYLALSSCAYKEDTFTRWAQGRVQLCIEFINSVDNASTIRSAKQSARQTENKGGALI